MVVYYLLKLRRSDAATIKRPGENPGTSCLQAIILNVKLTYLFLGGAAPAQFPGLYQPLTPVVPNGHMSGITRAQSLSSVPFQQQGNYALAVFLLFLYQKCVSRWLTIIDYFNCLN